MSAARSFVYGLISLTLFYSIEFKAFAQEKTFRLSLYNDGEELDLRNPVLIDDLNRIEVKVEKGSPKIIQDSNIEVRLFNDNQLLQGIIKFSNYKNLAYFDFGIGFKANGLILLKTIRISKQSFPEAK